MILYVDDICAINLQRTDGNSAVGQRRSVHRQRENGKKQECRTESRVFELWDFLRVQETRWEGEKARSLEPRGGWECQMV